VDIFGGALDQFVHGAVAVQTVFEYSGGGLLESFGAKVLREPQHPQGFADNLPGMAPVPQQPLEDLARGGTDAFGAREELIDAECQVGAMLGRSMRLDRQALVATGGARMTGDELAALEDLDRMAGESCVDTLTDEGVVDRVKCPAHLDVMIRMHSSAELPLGIFVTARRQGLARRPFLALKDAVPTPLALLEGLGVDGVNDFGDRSVQLREREELPVAQRPKDAPLGDENSILYGSLISSQQLHVVRTVKRSRSRSRTRFTTYAERGGC